MKAVAGATTLAEVASALGCGAEEASIVAELKSGSEQAYAWLIAHYHQPVYSLVSRIVRDAADAADTTQEVFLKVFRGIPRFHGESSLKTWIYRIAVHEACNRKRWWFRHKGREVALEQQAGEECGTAGTSLLETLEADSPSPFEDLVRREVREQVERALAAVAEPYRTAIILREIEELSYDEIAEVMQVSLGTVKSRLLRGREAFRKQLEQELRRTGEKNKIVIGAQETEVEVHP